MRATNRFLVALLLLGCASPAPAEAQSYVDELRKELKPSDPRWSSSRSSVAAGEVHPVLDWVSGRIYIVRPFEPGKGRKAELAFSPTSDPTRLDVRRRTLGTSDTLNGTAQLVNILPRRQRGQKTRTGVLVLEITYTVAPKRGAAGTLGGVAQAETQVFGGRYAIRAKGDVLLGSTTLPGVLKPRVVRRQDRRRRTTAERAGKTLAPKPRLVPARFMEKAVAQGVAYRRTSSVINAFTERSGEEDARLKKLAEQKIVSTCWVSEFSASAEENTSPRRATLGGVQFYYNVPEEIVTILAAEAPKHLFVVAHGWMNDRGGSLEFASKMVRGIQARAEQAGVDKADLAFMFLSWNSKRTLFMESALCAETIGHRELAPMLRDLRSRSPKTSVTLIGHSLGGRMMLATLQGPQRDMTSFGKWRRDRFRKWAMAGEDALDAPMRRMLHIALRGRTAPAPKVHAAVLFEAAIDVQTLIEPVGAFNYGDAPDATRNVRVLANCHSIHDDILRAAYTAANGFTNPLNSLVRLLDSGNGVQAIGRLGALRKAKRGGGRGIKAIPAEYFARIKLSPGTVDPSALEAVLKQPGARPLNAADNRAINVDMSEVMPQGGTPKLGGADGETYGAVDTHGEFFKPVSFDLIWRVTAEGVARGAP